MKTVQKAIQAAQTDSPFTFALSVDGVVDRHGDIVDVSTKSVDLTSFKENPIALAFHNHDQPIGVWKNIRIESGKLLADLQLAAKGTSEYIDTLRSLVEQKILKAVSIGFSAQEYEPIKGGGYRFTKWSLHEASLVSVPAHPQALAVAKSLGVKDGQINQFFDKEATSGATSVEKTSPGVSGKPIVKLKSIKEPEMKTYQEQIAAFEQRKQELNDQVKGIMQKSADEGRTLDATEAEAHDQAIAEVASVTKHIERLKAAESMAVTTAKPVVGDSIKAAADSRAGVITVRDNLAPGQNFARYVKCLALAKGNILQAEQIAKTQYPDSSRLHGVMKAAVAAGTTTDPTWGGALVDYTDFAGDFVNFLRPQTIVGRFGQGGIPALRSIPFNVKIRTQTSGGSAQWVGEGQSKPLTKFDFGTIELRWSKLAAISVLTDELVRTSSPSAELLVRDSLAEAIIATMDVDFVNPAKAEVANVSPASITNGVTAVPASGTDYDAFKVDAKAMMGNFITANIPLSQGVWIMQSTQALAFSLMNNALGQPEFPGMSLSGGTLLGLPVIVSQHVPAGLIVLAAANEIYLASDGQVMVDASREATLEMSDTPSGTATRSMWQNNELAVRAELYANYKRRRNGAVQIITGAAYS
jgi:HK97 family phage major capsid protein/HK97 family phage prohead protease